MKKLFILAIFPVILSGCIFTQQENPATSLPPVLPPTQPITSSFSYTHPFLGLTLKTIPPELVLKPTNKTIALESALSISDNPSGIAGNERAHRLAIKMEKKTVRLLQAVQEQSDYAFSQMFPQGDQKSFTAVPDFSWEVFIDGRKGYGFLEGAEGINTRYFFLALAQDATLLIALSTIGDFLNPAMAENKQINLADQVFQGLRLPPYSPLLQECPEEYLSAIPGSSPPLPLFLNPPSSYFLLHSERREIKEFDPSIMDNCPSMKKQFPLGNGRAIFE